MTSSQSIEEILAAAKPREAVARVLLDQELLDRHADADAAAAEAAAAGNGDEAVKYGELALELEAQVEAARVPFRFVGIGYRRWMDLLRDHPPTKNQPGLDHNPDTFPVAAVAASCADPVMTVEQVEALQATLNLAQWEALWHSCLLVNRGGDQVPKSLVAAGLTRRPSGGSERPPITSASRGRRSSAA